MCRHGKPLTGQIALIGQKEEKMKEEEKIVEEVIAEENPIIFPFIVEEVRDSSGKTINIWGRWIEFFDAILPLMNEEVFFPFFKGSNLALHHGVDLWVRGCKELASVALQETDTLPKFLATSDMETFAKEILRDERFKEAARGICRRIEEKLKKEEAPDNYIDWDKCDDVAKTDEYYPDEED